MNGDDEHDDDQSDDEELDGEDAEAGEGADDDEAAEAGEGAGDDEDAEAGEGGDDDEDAEAGEGAVAGDGEAAEAGEGADDEDAEYDDEEYDDDDEYDDDEYDDEYDEDDDEYYDYDDDYDGTAPSRVRMAVLALGIAIFVLLGWFVVRPALGGDDSTDEPLIADASTSSAPTESEGPDDTADDAVVTETSEDEALGDVTTADAPVETEPADVTTTEAPEDTEPPEVTTEAAEPVETEPADVTTTDAADAAETPTPTVDSTTDTDEDATYDTLPDGTPEPVVALFDVASITLTGAVPSQDAKDRLEALAMANAKPGQADTIVDNVTINPAVPIGVGVRIVELTSARFPRSSAEITPEHAAELDRMVAVMNALPNITALVIGHANPGENPLASYALSEQRATAVFNYLVGQGIGPDRLSARAVGDSDLLALGLDEATLALNRRTEFVLYGLLVE